MIPYGPYGGVEPLHPLLMLLAALALDALAGDRLWRFLPHPVKLIGGVIGALDRKLNRERRSEADRRVRGTVVMLLVVGGAFALGWQVARLTAAVEYGWVLELVLTTALLAQRSLFDHVRAVAGGLRQSLVDGRRAVAHIVGRDPEQLDDHGVARAAIESCAENFSDAVVAPVFWYVLLGFPGLLAYKAANTLDSMLGNTTPRYKAFGWASARFDDLVNLAPARLSGLFLALAAFFVPHARPAKAMRVMLKDARNHRSPNSGWPEAAMAGALDLALAGPRAYPGVVIKDRWIGDGRARATTDDILNALRLYAVACLINAGAVVFMLWLLAIKGLA